MRIYNGDERDSKNFDSTSYLQLNSCGSSVTSDTEFLIVRSGRCDYHILYVTEGEAEVYDGVSAYRLSAGDFMLYPPKAPQKYKRFPGSKDYWVHFNGFQVTEILNDASLPFGVNRAEESEEVRTVFRNLLSEYGIKNEKNVNNEKGLLLTLLYTLGGVASGKKAYGQNECIRNAVLYINEHYTKDFSNAFLAATCNLSLGRFEHIFKAETGISPSAYRQRLRVENARSLLTSSALSVGEISALCGFSDQLYFSRVFKTKVGLSPLEYRKAFTK